MEKTSNHFLVLINKIWEKSNTVFQQIQHSHPNTKKNQKPKNS
jgi:hypothetical protein